MILSIAAPTPPSLFHHTRSPPPSPPPLPRTVFHLILCPSLVIVEVGGGGGKRKKGPSGVSWNQLLCVLISILEDSDFAVILRVCFPLARSRTIRGSRRDSRSIRIQTDGPYRFPLTNPPFRRRLCRGITGRGGGLGRRRPGREPRQRCQRRRRRRRCRAGSRRPAREETPPPARYPPTPLPTNFPNGYPEIPRADTSSDPYFPARASHECGGPRGGEAEARV